MLRQEGSKRRQATDARIMYEEFQVAWRWPITLCAVFTSLLLLVGLIDHQLRFWPPSSSAVSAVYFDVSAIWAWRMYNRNKNDGKGKS